MNRREFLSTGAMAALFAGCRCPLCADRRPSTAVQLWVLRNLAMQDLPGTFAKVRALGLEGVELCWIEKYDAKAVRAAADANGLEICGAHIGLEALKGEALKRTMDYAATVGFRRIVIPYLSPDKNEKDVGGWWRRKADEVNAVAAELKKYGCRLGYHNHSTEFSEKVGDKTVWEIFVGRFSDDMLLQFDVGGVAYGGEDPAAWYRRYPGRCPVVHIRDTWDPKAGYFGVVGEPPPGKRAVDWRDLAAAFREDVPEWVVLEPASNGRFDTIERSLVNLRAFGYPV